MYAITGEFPTSTLLRLINRPFRRRPSSPTWPSDQIASVVRGPKFSSETRRGNYDAAHGGRRPPSLTLRTLQRRVIIIFSSLVRSAVCGFDYCSSEIVFDVGSWRSGHIGLHELQNSPFLWHLLSRRPRRINIWSLNTLFVFWQNKKKQ